MGLRGRLFLFLVLPMAAVFGGYGLLRIQHEEQALLNDEAARMAVTAKALQAAVENALRDRQISDIKRLLAELALLHTQIDRIRIFDLALRPLLVSNPLAIGEDVPAEGLSQAMEERQPILFYRRERGERVLYSLVPLRDRAGIVHGAMEIVRLAGYIDARLADARWDVAQRVGLLTVILAVLLWVGVRQTVLLPIRRLMASVRALAEGQPRPIPARGPDEFARLARSFNEMAERLAEAHARVVAETEARLDLARQVRQAEQLAVAGRIAAEVAHEIGTPLNVVSGRAEFLLQTLEPGDPRALHLQTIIAQSERITGILAGPAGRGPAPQGRAAAGGGRPAPGRRRAAARAQRAGEGPDPRHRPAPPEPRPGRPQPAPAGGHQPPGQRHRGDARRRTGRAARGAGAGSRRAARGDRRGRRLGERHPRGGPGARLRPLLHDEAPGAGDGPRARHLPGHRPRARRDHPA